MSLLLANFLYISRAHVRKIFAIDKYKNYFHLVTSNLFTKLSSPKNQNYFFMCQKSHCWVNKIFNYKKYLFIKPLISLEKNPSKLFTYIDSPLKDYIFVL